jgi:predicted RNase H-like HicB family nuclease
MPTWRVVFERTATGWSAYVPALAGLAATRDEAEQLIPEGMPFHLQGLAEEGMPLPDPSSVEVQTIAA